MGNSPSANQVINQKKKIIFDNLWNGAKSEKFGDEVQSLITSDKEFFLTKVKERIDTGKERLNNGYTDKDKYYNHIKEKADMFFDNAYSITYKDNLKDRFNDTRKDATEKDWNQFIDKFLSGNMNEDDYSKFAAKLSYLVSIQRDVNLALYTDLIRRLHIPALEKMIADNNEGFQNNETENDFSTIILIIIFALLFLHAFTDIKLF